MQTIKEIREDFEYQMKNNGVSSYIAFGRSIAGKRLRRHIILRYFNQLVDKSDYLLEEKRELIDQLVKISNSELK